LAAEAFEHDRDSRKWVASIGGNTQLASEALERDSSKWFG
jgi:hypothetical protein